MLVKLWNEGDPVPQMGPLYFRSGDEQMVRNAVCSVNNSSYPQIVEVKPNGENQLGLIHAYMLASQRSDHQWLSKTDFASYEYPTRTILMLCTEVIQGLQTFSSDRVASACSEFSRFIESHPSMPAKGLPSTLPVAIECILQLTHLCLRSLEHGSPFVHNNPTANNKAWWTGPTDIGQKINILKTDIPKRFGINQFPIGFVKVENWLDEIGRRFSQISKSAKVSHQQAILEASAYCAALAERYLLRGNCSLAVLLLHRSADLMMMKVCYKFIDFTKPGGQYYPHVVTNNNTHIHLLSSVEVADTYNVLGSNPNRTDALKNLNEWRNLLMQTHYMSDIADKVAIDVFRNVRPHLEKMGGAEWKISRDSYLEGISLKLDELLDIDGSLTSTFTIIDLKTWKA